MTERIRNISAYLCVGDAKRAIAYYSAAFGAEETFRLEEPSGKIGHAEMRIGTSTIMLSDEYPDHGAQSPQTIGGSPVLLYLPVDDADAVAARAVQAGGTLKAPVADQFYGERTGTLVDPFGHRWMISQHIEDVSADEMKRRMAEMPAS
jgi:PhnB protein